MEEELRLFRQPIKSQEGFDKVPQDLDPRAFLVLSCQVLSRPVRVDIVPQVQTSTEPPRCGPNGPIQDFVALDKNRLELSSQGEADELFLAQVDGAHVGKLLPQLGSGGQLPGKSSTEVEPILVDVHELLPPGTASQPQDLLCEAICIPLVLLAVHSFVTDGRTPHACCKDWWVMIGLMSLLVEGPRSRFPP